MPTAKKTTTAKKTATTKKTTTAKKPAAAKKTTAASKKAATKAATTTKKATTTRRAATTKAKSTTAKDKPASVTKATKAQLDSLPDNLTIAYIIGEEPYLYAACGSVGSLDLIMYRWDSEAKKFRAMNKYAYDLDAAMRIVRIDALKVRPANYPKRERLLVGVEEIIAHSEKIAKKLSKIAVATDNDK